MAIATKSSVAPRSGADGEAVSLPFNVPLPRDRYSWRIKKADFGQSKSSGNDMITLDVEIYYPEEVAHPLNGKTYNVAGRDAKMYFSLQDQALYRLLGSEEEEGFMEQIGLKPEIDTDNPDTKQFENKCFSAIGGSEKREQRKELMAAEITAGKKQGDPILNEDGSPSISYAVKVIGDITRTKHQPKNPF